MHFAPGASFQQQGMHIHDLSEYRKEDNRWDFAHTIKSLSFGEQLDFVNPLDKVVQPNKQSIFLWMMLIFAEFQVFQYFVKVVASEFTYLNGTVSHTNQFAVTEHLRDVSPRMGTQPTGMPGVFVIFDISPMLVKMKEYRKPFTHFLTDLCAIIGGVFSVAGIIDGAIFSAQRSTERHELGKQY